MKLLTKEEINKTRKDQTRELVVKNERLVSSLNKVLELQNDIEFDADKAKKVKDYKIWCEDIQTKMSNELKNLNAYKKLVEDKKEEYYNLVAKLDALSDVILTKQEELNKLDLQVRFNQSILEKQHG